MPTPALPRSFRWIPALTLGLGTLLAACAPQPDPYFVDREEAIADNRFLKAIHSPDVIEEEPPPEDAYNSDEEIGSIGQRHRGAEGKMGKPTSRAKSGLYAMKGPRDAIPRLARAGEGSVGFGGLGGEACADCGAGADRYDHERDNPWATVLAEPLSTFSIDVDTAAYSNVRRFLQDHTMPPPASVRVEEMINYFDYGYPQPDGEHPYSLTAEVAPCPWNPGHKLVHVGLQGKELPASQQGPRNLVFLVDVSGSMSSPDKLPLLKQGLERLTRTLGPSDRISMVTYAGASGLVLPPTSGAEKSTILGAIRRLESGGGTHGSAGIQLAYAQARKHLVQNGVNRVILASDGDFNVGVTDHDELVGLIERERSSGVFLSVLGFGRGNLNDHTMEQLADKGNGNYAYIDSEREAEKVLVTEGSGTLVTVAKDVKLQVEFNPAMVSAYRLIGYENRRLAAQDFKDDAKDAGELGAGHSVTGLYEIVPVGAPAAPGVDPLKYQRPAQARGKQELLTVKTRYKLPDADRSTEFDLAVDTILPTLDAASPGFRLATAVAAFGQRLRDPDARAGLAFSEVRRLLAAVDLPDPHGYRAELRQLVAEAERLTAPAPQQIAALVDDELGN